MDAEFKVELKPYDQAKLLEALRVSYPGNLVNAFDQSTYKNSHTLESSDFCAGYITRGSLFLVYNREGDTLKVYVETPGLTDVGNLQKRINEYFAGITHMLDQQKIKWSKPQATITLENYPLDGEVKTRKARFNDLLENQREKYFIAPIASLITIFLVLGLNLSTPEEGHKELLKSLILTLEAFIGLVLIIIIEILFVGNERKFEFNF